MELKVRRAGKGNLISHDFFTALAKDTTMMMEVAMFQLAIVYMAQDYLMRNMMR